MSNTVAVIQTCTGNLTTSKKFYEKLGFTKVSTNDQTVYTDGKMLIEINPTNTARVGLKLYHSDWQKNIQLLKQKTAILEIENGYLLSDPNGIKVYLVNGAIPYEYALSDNSFALPGNFAGLSIEAIDMPSTIAFWEALGYQKTMGSMEQGWMAFDNGSGIGISIMKSLACPHLFFNPGPVSYTHLTLPTIYSV